MPQNQETGKADQPLHLTKLNKKGLTGPGNGRSEAGGRKKSRTHHGVYMFQREVTAGSLFGEDAEEEKITTCGYHPP